jgi:Na+/H+ antiporter NhaD/arsenite permease-like protein
MSLAFGFAALAVLPEWKVLAGYIIFLASYMVFAVGRLPGLKTDRSGMAIVGAVAMVAVGVVPAGTVLQVIDFPTIVLLFCMMLLIGFLRVGGFFESIARLTVNRLPPRYLLPAVIFATGILSAFLVNDIVCLVMVPFVALTARRMGLRPLPYLLGVATASNIGSVATITGNPQNMLIGSVSGISYRSFLAHLGPVALIGLGLDWLVLWLFSASEAASARQREAGPQTGRTEPAGVTSTDQDDGAGPELASRHLAKPVLVTVAVVAGFLAGAPPAMVAALGAAVMLITRRRDPQQAYAEVNWDLLIFFVGLFVVVGGAENAGLTGHLLAVAEHGNLQQSGIFAIVTAVISNLVSNVPAVMLLKGLVPSFSNAHHAWLVLAMASTLAGNLTITGSVANLIVVEQAREWTRIGFWDYAKVGAPVTALTLLVGWGWLRWVA